METLGATTYICTDKTGTLTQNRMAVVEVWTPVGTAYLEGTGYEPTARIQASSDVMDRMRRAAESAVLCVSGRVVQGHGMGRRRRCDGSGRPCLVASGRLRLRRFLTYHLTDNVAELAPLAAWALTGGQLPLAIGVLRVLASISAPTFCPPSRWVQNHPVAKSFRAECVGAASSTVIGVASYEVSSSAQAEITVLVDDAWQGDGIGSLLIEHYDAALALLTIESMGFLSP